MVMNFKIWYKRKRSRKRKRRPNSNVVVLVKMQMVVLRRIRKLLIGAEPKYRDLVSLARAMINTVM